MVAPNLRGYPPSDAPDNVEAYAMPRLLGDLHGLLDHLGRERCILVGNDWGGYVGLGVCLGLSRTRRAADHPQRAPSGDISARGAHQSSPDRASQYERAFHTAAPPYPRWYNYYRADPIKVPSSMAESAAMETPDLSAHFFAGVGRPPAATSLRLNVPTLVIWGLSDPACYLDRSMALKSTSRI